VDCPIAGEGPSLLPGCRRCPMVQHSEQSYNDYLMSGGAFISRGAFVESRYQPNTWLRNRRLAAVLSTI